MAEHKDLLAALARSISAAKDDRAGCGCVIGSVHRYACASVGHVDRPRPSRPELPSDGAA